MSPAAIAKRLRKIEAELFPVQNAFDGFTSGGASLVAAAKDADRAVDKLWKLRGQMLELADRIDRGES